MKLTDSQKRDRSLILIVPILGCVIFQFFIGKYIKSNNISVIDINGQNIIQMLLGVWATLLGFIITAESILIAFRGGEFTNFIISSGHMRNVLFSYMQTCIVLFLCICIFVPIAILSIWNEVIFVVFCICISLSMFNVGISLLFLFIMLETANK